MAVGDKWAHAGFVSFPPQRLLPWRGRDLRPSIASCRQIVEKRLGVSQVGGVKTLRKPVVQRE
jgi:hypothetical protein